MAWGDAFCFWRLLVLRIGLQNPIGRTHGACEWGDGDPAFLVNSSVVIDFRLISQVRTDFSNFADLELWIFLDFKIPGSAANLGSNELDIAYFEGA